MPSESEQTPETPAGSDEKKLCVSCMFLNEPDAHRCAKCRAPMTTYAGIGPYEHIFTEGQVNEQVDERPRKLIVLLGTWLLLGMEVLGIAVIAGVLFYHLDMGLPYVLVCVFLLLPISLFIIWKTSRSYLARPRGEGKPDA